MTKLITILTLIFSLNSCAQEKDCVKFKTGNFIYLNDSLPWKITRTENKQIEIDTKTGIEIYSTVEWKSDCEYVMTYEKILNHPQDVSNVIGKKIFVEILETNGNKIKVLAKSDAINEKFDLLKIE